MVRSQPVLVYDSDCGFCTSTANWISQKWPDGEGPTAVPWQRLTSGFEPASLLSEEDLKRAA